MIRLRPYKQIDADYIIKWIDTEKDFTKWCANNIKYPLKKEALKELDDEFKNSQDTLLFTALDETGAPVGFFAMKNINYSKNSVHIGYVIIDKSRRNSGYGKQMMRQVMKYAFEILCLTRITLRVFDNNEEAHRCYLSVGFTDENYDENNFKFKDEIWGCYLMSIEK